MLRAKRILTRRATWKVARAAALIAGLAIPFVSALAPAVVVGGLLQPSVCYASEQRVSYVFILDASLSMVGRGEGAVNIMPRVKDNMKSFVQSASASLVGSRVVVATFSEDLLSFKEFKILGNQDVSAVASYVDGIEASGKSTYIYRSMRQIIEQVTASRSEDERIFFYLYTDGLEEEYGHSIADTVREFRAKRGPNDWLYYIALGAKMTDEERRSFEEGPGANAIQRPSPPTVIELRYLTLNFGDIDGKPVKDLLLATRGKPFSSKEGVKVSFELGDSPDIDAISWAGAEVALSPKEAPYADRMKLSLSGQNVGDIPPGIYIAPCSATVLSPDYVILPGTFKVVFSKGDASYNLFFGDAAPEKVGTQVSEIRAEGVWNAGYSHEFTLALTSSAILKENAEKVTPPEVKLEVSKARSQILVFPQDEASDKTRAGQHVFRATGGTTAVLLRIPKGFPAGRYDAKIVVFSPEAEVKGEKVQPSSEGYFELPLRIDVAAAPLSLGAKAAIVAAAVLLTVILLLLVASLVKKEPAGAVLLGVLAATGALKPRISSLTLSCREPREERRDQEFVGLRQQTIGPGTDFFPNLPQRLSLQATLRKGKVALLVSGESEVFQLKPSGETKLLQQQQAYVWDGDVVQVGKFKFRVDSNDLVGGAYEDEL
jgi:hypothetical protein